MKTIYLIKSFFPFLFLPFAPAVIQVELERQGLLHYGSSNFFTLLVQIVFTIGIIFWLARVVKRKNQTKAFLKMSCISKKVFHNDEWVSVEQYLADYHNVVVSHGLTPEEANVWMRESEEYLEKEIQSFNKAEVSAS
jgi:hypothetical protein